jgi:DNA-binding response OmpR family regulator
MPDQAAHLIPVAADELLNRARILLLEDEMMAASMLEMVLGEAGCVVIGPAATVVDGLLLAKANDIDAAVLDVNLGGELVFPVADALAARGVPFIFVTGYGVTGVTGERYPTVPIVQKPYDDEAVVETIAKLLAARRSAR